MGDEHLDIVLSMKSDEVIKSSVEDLVPILSESEGILDNMCDVPFRDNSPPLDISKDQFKDFFNSNDDSTSIDDDSFFIDDIDYVEAPPPHSKLISLKEVKDFHLKEGELEDDILHEKLLNIHLLIDKIESLNDNPTSNHVLKYHSPFLIPVKDSDSLFEKYDTSLFYSYNSLPEFETFSDHTKETSSGSTTTHVNYSLSKYDSFIFEIEPDQGELTSVVMEDNLGEPRVHVPNVLPTHPIFMNSDSTTIHADISLSFFDHFHFKIEPVPGDLTSIIDPGIRENVYSMTNVNLPFKDDQSHLFSYVVCIFLPFITYPIAPPYLLSFRNKDTIFDTGISIYRSFMPGVSHRSGTFMKFNGYPNHLNESPMENLSSTCSPWTNEFRVESGLRLG
nr:hypothetical protein [Tanacetum cinerariifolium]